VHSHSGIAKHVAQPWKSVPHVTLLYHLKAAAKAFMHDHLKENIGIMPAREDWRWSIVEAKGIVPGSAASSGMANSIFPPVHDYRSAQPTPPSAPTSSPEQALHPILNILDLG